MNKLWELYPYRSEEGPWDPWYDCCFGMVVRAPDEDSARELASAEAGAEGGKAWKDKLATGCRELTGEGEPEVVLRNVHAA